MEIAKYVELNKINVFQNVSLKNIRFDENVYYVDVKREYKNIVVEKYVLQETSCTTKRIVDSLKLVHLEEDVLNKKMSCLSLSEQLKVELAIGLILNKNCLLFPYFDIYFMEKELLFFKKLFKKLVKKYKKTFVFLNSRLSFLFEFADRIVLYKSKKQCFVLDNPSFYEEELEKNIVEMPIVELVKYMNKEGKKIMKYTDLKELLKAIFREV